MFNEPSVRQIPEVGNVMYNPDERTSVRKGRDELRGKERTRKKEVGILAQKSHIELS